MNIGTVAGAPWHFLLVSRLSASAPWFISLLMTSWSLQSRFRVRMMAPNRLATDPHPLSCLSHDPLLAQPKDTGLFLWKHPAPQTPAGNWPDGSVSKAHDLRQSPRTPMERRERERSDFWRLFGHQHPHAMQAERCEDTNKCH